MVNVPIKYIPLGEPIVIDGKEVIVFRDVLGSVSAQKTGEKAVLTVIEKADQNGRPPIFIDEHELNRMRENYPGIKVYGLWQILFHNNKVKLGSEVVVYPLKDNEGAYIRLDRNMDLHSPASIVSSGEYVDNYISELAGAADFDLVAHAIHLDVDARELKLPKTPAFTRPELYSKLRQEEIRRWSFVGIFAAILAIITGLFNFYLYNNYKIEMADYQAKKTLIDDLGVRIGGLKRERLAVRPNDSIVLERLVKIFMLDPKAATPQSGNLVASFAGIHRLTTSPNLTFDITKAVEGVSGKPTNKMTYDLIVSPDPTNAGHKK
jgi:hypothetical protein